MGDVSLRQWLDKPERSVDAFECLHIFRQIVEIVSLGHFQGTVVHNVRPSRFVISSFNHIKFIESPCSDSAVSLERFDPITSKNALSETSCMQSKLSVEESEENRKANKKEKVEGKNQPLPMKQILVMENSWYTSPEEASGGPTSCASDVYQLGVLLFELFFPISLREEKSRTMSSLKHRILPPQSLSKWPKEASFCLLLLHPEPGSRPTLSELLETEFLNERRNDLEDLEAQIELKDRIEEQELLLEFLLLIQQQKHEASHKLQQTITLLCSDIEAVMKQQSPVPEKNSRMCPEITDENRTTSSLHSIDIIEYDKPASFGSKKIHNTENAENQESFLFKSSQLMNNLKKLELSYFSMRRRPIKPLGGWISPFLEGFCKYLSYNTLKVRANLKQGGFLNSSNLVYSISFDRDGELFATAGANKKIEVFECDIIINEDWDIHYPVVEMASSSKISNICWNSYIKRQIASSNFDGVVQVWDVTRSQVLMELREHEKRVWSIDFSSADPMMLASGSDDGSVKLWSMNQGVSIGTIKTKANVCCVQFPLDSCRSLAFGSADHKIYYYDLRNSKVPVCTFAGHDKTVSYVKFVNTRNLVSASTDNSLKLWDLSMCTSGVIDTPLQSFTGHLNVKNFVGLSVSDGYIATGSETNEVFVYHKSFPMPALSFKFHDDPLTGQEAGNTAQFISSVCWRGQSSTLVAANSAGHTKILEMV